jgi:hypothetical protein
VVEPAHPRLSISAQCPLLRISRSRYYYALVGQTLHEIEGASGGQVTIQIRADAAEISLTMHPHPTLAETLGLAA